MDVCFQSIILHSFLFHSLSATACLSYCLTLRGFFCHRFSLLSNNVITHIHTYLFSQTTTDLRHCRVWSSLLKATSPTVHSEIEGKWYADHIHMNVPLRPRYGQYALPCSQLYPVVACGIAVRNSPVIQTAFSSVTSIIKLLRMRSLLIMTLYMIHFWSLSWDEKVNVTKMYAICTWHSYSMSSLFVTTLIC